MTSPTPPADDQPGSVEVSERDREVAADIHRIAFQTAWQDRSKDICEGLIAAYRREIERGMRDTSRPG